MNFQYYHRRRYDFLGKLLPTGGNTYFLDTLTKSQLLHLFNLPEPVIRMGFGEVDCHVKDNYDKRIGREMAISRARTRDWTLIEIRPIGGGTFKFFLQHKERVVYLEGRHNSDKLYFRGVS